MDKGTNKKGAVIAPFYFNSYVFLLPSGLE